MALLKRRSSTADPEPPAEAEQPVIVQPTRTAGKGRPTPKRSEARAARGKAMVAPPKNRKEIRAQARAERRRMNLEHRAAMASDDVKKLPDYERAPERIIARNVVDSRVNVGPLFLLFLVIYFATSFVPNYNVQRGAAFVMLFGMFALVVDSLVLSRQVTRRVAEKYPTSRVRVRIYAVRRAILPRRWRLPKPRVDRHGNPV